MFPFEAQLYTIKRQHAIHRKMGFVVDVDAGSEVWNQPVFGYRFKIIETRPRSLNSANSTVSEAKVVLRMYYALEENTSWSPLSTLKGYDDYSYWLELDGKQNIVGGSWVEGSSLPDFAWSRKKSKLPQSYSRLIK